MHVEDDGEGISYSQQGRVFEPFAQVGNKRGGVGLGLALCKEIVLLHGGTIAVESAPGQGARSDCSAAFQGGHLARSRARSGSSSGGGRAD